MPEKILFLTHALNNSGAPIVLNDMVKMCCNNGMHVEIVALEDGPLRTEYEAAGIPIMIADNFLDYIEAWRSLFSKFDIVVANTLLCIEAIYILNTTNVPTIWWIHEPEYWFKEYVPIFPKKEELKSNIHIYGVSPITNELIKEYCGYEPKLLPFGIADRKDDFTKSKPKNDAVRFILPATFSRVKGQDILVRAVETLSDDVRSKCLFRLCGAINRAEKDYYNAVESGAAQYTEIEMLGALSHDEVLKVMADSDFCIVPSRSEPFSATAVEAMMMEIVPLISDVCGVKDFVSDTENCFVFPSGDAEALAKAITNAVKLIRKKEQYAIVSKNARKCYENNLSTKVFEKKVMSVFDEISRKG